MATARAPNPREAMAEQSTLHTMAKLSFDEPRITLPWRRRAWARKVSRCSRTTVCRTVFSGSRRR
jgi:hypothetical protein